MSHPQLPTVTRETAVAELRRIIQKVHDEFDASLATDLDLVVHQLEMLALEEGQKQSTEYWHQMIKSIKDERDAAIADLHRIGCIIDNPLKILDGKVLEPPPGQPGEDSSVT